MSKTAYDVVVKSLQVVNYIAAEQTPTARDYEDALAKYENFHEWISKEFTKKARWGYDQVDERVWTFVATWFAADLVLDFGGSVEDTNRIIAGSKVAERRLREVLARKSLETTEVEYY